MKDGPPGDTGARDTHTEPGPNDVSAGDSLPDLPADPCAARTADGTHLNPGCDPNVATIGMSALSADAIGLAGQWLIVSGTRWWTFDPGANGGTGQYTGGGKDLAARLRQEKPDCAAKTLDGIALNPGCDPDMQSAGPSAMSSINAWGKAYWVVLSGMKHWFYDPGVGAFLLGGKDLIYVLKQLAPDCTKKSIDGTALNPGCDPDVAAKGFSAMTNVPPGSTISWAGFSAKKLWIFDPASGTNGAFVNALSDVTQFLQALAPTSCASMTADGIPLNPGCDLDVQATGFTATATVELGGVSYWLCANGKKWWFFDEKQGPLGSFVAGGRDLAAMLKAGIPHP